MKKLAVIGTGGVGKSAITASLAMAFSYRARKDGRLIVAVDGDVTEGMLSKILLGERGDLSTMNEVLLGILSPEEVLYEPSVAMGDPRARTRATGLGSLRVVPACQKGLADLKFIPARSLVQMLYGLEDHLESSGASVALVDFPPGDPTLANLTAALALWTDAAVAVTTPSRRRISATAHACRALSEMMGTETLAVVLNKYDQFQPFDEYGNRWEDVTKQFFGSEPFVIPHDASLSQAMTMDLVPLSEMPSLESARAIVRGYGVGIQEPLFRALWKQMEELKPKRRQLPPLKSASRPSVSPTSEAAMEERLEEFFLGPMRSETPEAGTKEPEAPLPEIGPAEYDPMSRGDRRPRDVMSELMERKPSIFSWFRRGRIRLIYPEGGEEIVKKSDLEEALLTAGFSRGQAKIVLSRDELDLCRVPVGERDLWDVALIYLGLKPLGGRPAR